MPANTPKQCRFCLEKCVNVLKRWDNLANYNVCICDVSRKLKFIQIAVKKHGEAGK
eukprot:TRINITY_DN4512_c0_g1_i1.p2 TRINITY_DN4512_c0_g1~~TRINITY_DN4512_c0_g1_i1.p2  ORF type:complete len:56 (-),score=6.97 TRINITY_DN4512_c0_g1_i1:586-753(-)